MTELERIWAGAPVRIEPGMLHEVTLMAQKRDEWAVLSLLSHHVGVLRGSVGRFVTLPVDDARQMALLALMVAVDRYEGEDGQLPRLVSTLLDTCWTAVGQAAGVSVPGRTMRLFRAALAKGGGVVERAAELAPRYEIDPVTFRQIAASRFPVNLVEIDSQPVELYATDTGELAGRARACLPEKLRRVIDYGFGFVDGVPHTDVETAERLGMSPQSVQRARQKALAAMRVELGVGAVA